MTAKQCLKAHCRVQISEDIGMTDAQYGMLTGYAYYLLLSVAMIVQGYVIDKYSLNRMYVVGFGGVLGAAGLLMQVCVSAATSCPHIYNLLKAKEYAAAAVARRTW